MGIDGAVLIFLPGWNTISMLKKFLQSHPRYCNTAEFLILPLHSQVPREDQRLVFRPVAPGIRKVGVPPLSSLGLNEGSYLLVS